MGAEIMIRRRFGMHIPDGYLSPATCAVGYAIMLPFWATAVKKVKVALNTKLIPLMVIGAAFSFVLMMFNVPIPGGTTAHAVGAGILAVILGPGRPPSVSPSPWPSRR